MHAEVHRLVITDDEQRVIGIISLSDILDALVIRPHGTAFYEQHGTVRLTVSCRLLGEMRRMVQQV